MRKGFTLIELAIVLVIIGVIIGGIIIGQSMIETARVNRFVKNLQQYDAAVSNFKQANRFMPGDTSTNGVGNEDGMIAATQWDGYEVSYFWEDLSNAGLTTDTGGTYTHVFNANNFPFSGNAPKSAVGNNFSVIPSQGYYNFGLTTATTGTAYPGGGPDASLRYNITAAIDNKIDDGGVMSGNMRLLIWSGNISMVVGTCQANIRCGIQILIGATAPN